MRHVIDQICSLIETTIKQRAGERGLPMGLPRCCLTHLCPNAKVCILRAVRSSEGTVLKD